MSDRVLAWVLRALWAAVPFAVWPALGEALRHHSTAVRTTASVAGWAVWAAILVATLVPHPVGMTGLRCLTPAVVAAAVAALAGGQPSVGAGALAVAWSVVVLLVSFLPQTAVLFVNGPAYPNERRFPLAVPAALLLGPLELAWTLVVGLPVAGLLLLAARQWVLGAVAVVLAVAALRYLGRALHRLSRRWVVFVPAGVVLHDPMSLREPVLFRRQVIETLGPAPAGSDSLDLTQAALGLALEMHLREKVPMTRITARNRAGEEGASARLLFSPTRPGAVLAEAARRNVHVGA
jgi:hypothetical protein